MILALLVALSLAAPGDTLIRANLGKTVPSKDDKVGPILSIPFLATGPLIEEDANTVAHVYWNGSALVDTKGNSWTMTGTVPQNVASPFYPDGFTGAQRKGAGPFSTTPNAWYTAGSANDVLDFAGDFMCAAVMSGSVNPPQNTLEGVVGAEAGGGTPTAGWRVALYNNSMQAQFYSTAGGVKTAVATTVPSGDGTITVGAWGRSGLTGYAQVNLGSVASIATVAIERATGIASRLGSFGSSAAGFTGTLLEVYCTSSPWNATTAAAIQARVFGQITSTGTPLTVTRSSTATYESPAGTLWTAPAGALRVNEDGALIEQTATNYALNSGTHPKTTEASASVTTGAAVAWHAGTGTMTLAAGTATVTGLSCTTVAAGTLCPFTVTVAGTMLITTTAGTTRVQIEKGSVASSYIATAGTAATRSPDTVFLTNPIATNLQTTSLCWRVTAATYGGAAWNAMDRGVMALDSTVSFGLTVGMDFGGVGTVPSGSFAAGLVDTSPDRAVRYTNAALSAGAHALEAEWVYVNDSSVPSLKLDGVTPATTTATLGTSLSGNFNAQLDLGMMPYTWLNGYLKNVKLYNVPCSKAR